MMVVQLSAICLLVAAQTSAAPGDLASISKQAREAQAAGRLQDAVRFYGEGVQLRPAWKDGWWSLGTLLYEQQRFPEAEVALNRFVNLAPDPWPAYALLSLCEYETRHYDSAEKHIEEWAARKPPASKALMADAFFHWALLLTLRGRFEQAVVLLASQAKAGNRNGAIIEAFGLASLRIPHLPEDYPPNEREPVWIAGRAALESRLRRFDQAETDAKRLLVHYAAHPNVHYFLGILLLDANDSVGAASEFQQELKISPQHVPALLQLAFYNVERGEPDKALPLAERAVAIAPEDFVSHAALGKALLASGRFQESARHLETARRIAPQSPYVRWALSQAYAALGRHEDAERERAAFGRLKPRTPQEDAR
jgi:tetratricopeptide (TPR) repeat protein